MWCPLTTFVSFLAPSEARPSEASLSCPATSSNRNSKTFGKIEIVLFAGRRTVIADRSPSAGHSELVQFDRIPPTKSIKSTKCVGPNTFVDKIDSVDGLFRRRRPGRTHCG